MKLLMENWRQYINEKEEIEIDSFIDEDGRRNFTTDGGKIVVWENMLFRIVKNMKNMQTE